LGEAVITHGTISLVHEADFGIEGLYFRPNVCRVEADDSVTLIEPKVMEVLILLARAKGENVTRDQLIEVCWEGRVVSEDAITRTLSKARKIGALTNPPAFRIETRAKIGVRLVSSERTLHVRDVNLPEQLSKIEPLLIVFPFENLSADADLKFFSDGVSEEMLSRIIRGSKLKVVGRSSSFQFHGEHKVAAAQALNASHIVDGSVRRAGNRVRINAHLTEVASGAGIWADQFEGDLSDIFGLQDSIADGIAQALFAKFTPANRAPIDPTTYDLYLRARDLQTATEFQAQSIASLERVVEQAPDFADGWGRLATLRALLRMNTPYQERTLITRQLQNDIARCHALDPDNPQANYAAYWLINPYGAFLDQERIINKALSHGHQLSDDLAIASYHLYNVGRMSQAYDYAFKANSFDPSSWAVSINYAISLWPKFGAKGAQEAMREHVAAWPQDQQGTGYLLLLSIMLEDWAEVDRLIEPKRLEKFPFREHSGFIITANVLRSPQPSNKQFLFELVRSRALKSGSIDCTTIGVLSLVGLAQRYYDELFSVRIGPTGTKHDVLGMMGYRTHLLFTPACKEGRADPRFVTLCARLGLVEYWLETGLWPDCADEVPYDFRTACYAAQGVVQDRFEL
jgi:TolB-like protein